MWPDGRLWASGPGELEQDDRVQEEQDCEEDGPAVQIALDHRAPAERTRAAAHAKGAGKAGILAGVHQDEKYDDHREGDLDDRIDRFHALRLPKGPCDGQQTPRRSGVRGRELAPDGRKIRILGSEMCTDFCQSDYESFTDSWFAADMNPARRIRGITDYLRRAHQCDDQQMTDNPA